MNEPSPSARYDLHTGVLSKSSLVDRKLYLVRNNFYIFNRRSRVRAVVTRGSTGLVGQNTSCKAHKVCISLWPTGWDDVRTRAESPF